MMGDALTTVLWIYAGIGAVVALAFLVWGMDRVDPAAEGAYAVRPLLLPGLILLWPVVAFRWLELERQRESRP
jgi:hypothetical protein